MVPGLSDFQLHRAQKGAVEGVPKHNVGFPALVFRLRDDNADQLGLYNSLGSA